MTAILGLAIAPGARAASLTSLTIAGPTTGSFDAFPIPCLPEFGIVTFVGYGVFHLNFDKAGDGWITSTETGSFSFLPTDPTFTEPVAGVSYAGTGTTWFGGNFNLQNLVATTIIEISATGSDGSTLTIHLLMSVTFTPSGTMTASPVSAVCGT